MEMKNSEGPTGTYGCACRSRDPQQCYAIRYGTKHEYIDEEFARGEECECQCHGFEDDEDELIVEIE
jgi:hypothetical protein